MTTGLINFVANGTVTVNTQSNITSVGTLAQLTVAGNSNLGAVSNVHITGGSANYVLTTDGTGNLSWNSGGNIPNAGTVTNVNTSGSGLGFTLTGGPITTTGTVTLSVPSDTTLRTNLNIGNVANLNLNGNGSTYLAGNGSFTVPAGTYSNSNVANYLPNYTGNLSAGNANINGTLIAITGNISGNLVAGNANINGYANVTGNINTAGLISATGNVTGNYINGNGYNLTNIQASAIIGTINATTAGTVVSNAQPNITSVGILSNLSVSGNTNVGNLSVTGNANLGNALYANYFIGSGNNLSNIQAANITGTVANANYAVNSGNANLANYVIQSAQSNITSLGTLNVLTVNGTANLNGTTNFTNNASYTGTNVSLGNVSNLHITGGTNGYFLQTDGAGNLNWVNGTTTGNGVVGGSNTQVQYNNAGNFGGSAGLTFNSTSNTLTTVNMVVTGNLTATINSPTTSSNIFITQTQIINANAVAGAINLDALNGTEIFNANTYGANVGFFPGINLNLRGNSTISFNSSLSNANTIQFQYNQIFKNTGNTNINVHATLTTLTIDGSTISGNQSIGPISISSNDGYIFLLPNQQARYALILNITKLSTSPTYNAFGQEYIVRI
jgi:hypothetical protein